MRSTWSVTLNDGRRVATRGGDCRPFGYSPNPGRAFIIMCGRRSVYSKLKSSLNCVSRAQSMPTELLRKHARDIWDAAVAAVRPEPLLEAALSRQPLAGALARARRVIVVGGGKAGAAMAAALEENLADRL